MADPPPLELGHQFRDPALLERALTHSSFVNEAPGQAQSNEVLEYLGDAVLDMIVAEVLVTTMPEAEEGTLTRLRASMVAEASLGQVAAGIGLGAHLRLGRGEDSQGGRERPSLLADALEAVIGAAYQDGGLDAARCVVLRLFGPRLAEAANASLDPKSRLQEVVQARRHVTPSYRLVRSWGPDHDRFFEVVCLIGEDIVGTGVGRTKKEAATAAATSAMEGEGAGEDGGEGEGS